jgi:ComF family protein
MLAAALDLILPPTCDGCEAPVDAPGQLCAACFRSVDFITEPLCRRCGLPFASDIAAGPRRICPTCAAAPPPWTQARAAMLYNDAARRLILPLKHAGREDNAATLALHMHRAGRALLARADLLVPVPLHRWRLLLRRANQSVLLARALSRRARVALIPDALQRLRATPRLGGLSAAQRAELLAAAIAVRPSRCAALSGRHILLIDDVLTSGATAGACARALLDAGAANVDVLVASRVADPRGDPAAASGQHPGTDDAED